MKSRTDRTEGFGTGVLMRIGAFGLALVCVSVVLLLAGVAPLDAFREIMGGAVGSWSDVGYVLRAWVPLLLAAVGLVGFRKTFPVPIRGRLSARDRNGGYDRRRPPSLPTPASPY